MTINLTCFVSTLFKFINDELGLNLSIDKEKIFYNKFYSDLDLLVKCLKLPSSTIDDIYTKRESIRRRIIESFLSDFLDITIGRYRYKSLEFDISINEYTNYLLFRVEKFYNGSLYCPIIPLWDDRNFIMSRKSPQLKNEYSLNDLFSYCEFTTNSKIVNSSDIDIPFIVIEKKIYSNIHKAFLHLDDEISFPFLEFCTNSKYRVNIDNINFIDKLTEYQYFNKDEYIISLFCRYNSKEGFHYY